MSATPQTSTAGGDASYGGGAATVSALLFGAADAAQALANATGWHRVQDRLRVALAAAPDGERRLAGQELGSATVGLLELRLGDILVAGWRKHRALVAAGRATMENPAATELVQLGTHRITTAHRPYVDVSLNGAKVVTVHFDLSLVLDIDTLLGTVRRGRLVALASGRCLVSASLSCEGFDLASRQAVIDPLATVDLGAGIPLTAE